MAKLAEKFHLNNVKVIIKYEFNHRTMTLSLNETDDSTLCNSSFVHDF